jgi:hypothetical protein
MQYVPLERINASIRIHRCIIAIGRDELMYTDPQLFHPYVKDALSNGEQERSDLPRINYLI